MILYHVTKKIHLQSILKNGLQPKIGKRSSRLGEEAGIFLFPALEDMENALTNWLGEQYDEEEELVVLKISLPDDFPLETTVLYERVSKIPIPPEQISYFQDV